MDELQGIVKLIADVGICGFVVAFLLLRQDKSSAQIAQQLARLTAQVDILIDIMRDRK
jgi:hypothetical protein